MEMIATQSSDVLIVDSGWEIAGPMAMIETRPHTIEEYLAQLRKLHVIGQSIQAWTGDVYLAMTEHLSSNQEKGGKALEIATEAGFDRATIVTYGWVCKKVPFSTRVENAEIYPNLTFNHFRAVAKEDEDEQVKWLGIAGEEGMSVAELRKAIKGLDWEPRYFNHWSAFPIESWQQKYPGQIPGGILSNILYYTTSKGELVIDPFGGGGNMARACERMGRKCITYDISPKFPGIHKHNVVFPFPDAGAQLVFLDPPYFKQKKGEYASDPADLSNIENPDQFHLLLETVCDNAREALDQGGYLALIIGASQTKDYYIDHAAEMYCRLKDKPWRHINTIAAAYPTTQYSGSDINHAKTSRIMLNLYTSIQIWRKIA